jgi:chemotaxis signal transduction protein
VRQIVVFSCEQRSYALPLDHVVELIEPLPWRAVEEGRGSFAGVASHKGQLLPIADLEHLFGLRSKPEVTGNAWLILSPNGTDRMVLCIDGSAQQLETASEDFIEASSSTSPYKDGILLGLYKFGDAELVPVIDIRALLLTTTDQVADHLSAG